MCDCWTDHDTDKHLREVNPAVGRWVDADAIRQQWEDRTRD